jgi:hypothetical protein
LLQQINSLLQPLVGKLNRFSKGIWFDFSFCQPRGRYLKALIFPLIAELPALRKTAGFTSHNSKNFCSYCLLTQKNINIIDPTKFEPRTHESHLAQLFWWNQASTHAERKKISDEQGVRYSALNALPYWRPIKFCGIELMHSMILGNLKDHAFTFLGLHKASTTLKVTYKDRKNRQLPARGHNFDFLHLPEVTEDPMGKRKRPEQVDLLPTGITPAKPPQIKRTYRQKKIHKSQ